MKKIIEAYSKYRGCYELAILEIEYSKDFTTYLVSREFTVSTTGEIYVWDEGRWVLLDDYLKERNGKVTECSFSLSVTIRINEDNNE